MATNLYEYYTSQGSNLPSVQERAVIYEQQGLGKASDYKGTATQNTQLLGKLNPNQMAGNKPTVSPVTITGDIAEGKIKDATKGIGKIQMEQAKPKTYDEQLQDIATSGEGLESDFLKEINNIRKGNIKYTADEQAQLDFITQSISNANNAQEKFNRQAERGTRLLSVGEFAPVRQQSALNQTIQSGLDEIKNINMEGASKLGEARQAIRDKRFDEIVKTYGELNAMQDRRSKIIQQLRDNAMELEKFQFEKQKYYQDYDLAISKIKQQMDGKNSGIIPGVSDADAKLVSLVKDYRDFINAKSALGLMLNSGTNSQAQSLISQITAEYKQAKKLGTLDAGVQKLMDGLLGKTGISKYSVDAQVKAVDSFLDSLGYVSLEDVSDDEFLDTPNVNIDNNSFYNQ
jgi:hypothetical protein